MFSRIKLWWMWRAVLPAVVFLILTGLPPADFETVWGDQMMELFRPAPSADLTAHRETGGAPDNPAVRRSRLVTLELGPVMDRDRPRGQESFILNLFDDVNLIAIKEGVQTNSPGQIVWSGRIKDAPGSLIIMVVDDGQMAGNINLMGEKYQVRPVSGPVHVIQEIDQSKFPQEKPPIPVDSPPQRLDQPPTSKDNRCLADNRRTLNNTADTVANFRGPASSGDIIDIYVVYTAAAAAGSGNIVAEINLAVAETNEAYRASGITQQIRLVGSSQVDYAESGGLDTDLTALQDSADGQMDAVHDWRNTAGADGVILMVETGDACGIAYLMTNVSITFAPYAFAVVRRDCATGYYSFGHELGHIMGARHDCYEDSELTPYTYSHGYVDGPNRWRTIMAYDNECQDIFGYSCDRIQYFSNPDLTYLGAVMGVSETTVTTTTTTTTTTAAEAAAGGGGGGGGGGCFISAAYPWS